MRYTVLLLAFALIITVIMPSAVQADEESPDGHGIMGGPRMHDGSCEHDGPGMMEGRHGMRMMHRHMEPWELGWFERPWNFWRHLDEGTLDLDAMHFLANVRTVAILPFADLTSPTIEGESMMKNAGGPRRIVDNLAAEFMSRGYLVVPPVDAGVLFRNYMEGEEILEVEQQEIANNRLFFDNMPERALEYYLESIPGLERQRLAGSGFDDYPDREDIQAVAAILGADCIIRGFVNEFAVSRDVDADWRTFIPPFLGLINPDRRTRIEVAYYLYDGHSGEMIWNGTIELTRDCNWPMFTSERELIDDTEHEVVWEMTSRVIPNWMDLIWSHPEWVPFEMWYEYDEFMDDGPMMHPGWLNPMRRGWHDKYERHDCRFDLDPAEGYDEDYAEKECL